MKVLYFGSYNLDYPRNRILIDGLKENGVEVITVHDRSNLLFKYIRLFFKHWKYRNKYDYMVVGFPGFTVMPLARMIATAPVIFDAFLSFYDSNVFDRKVSSPGSLRAKYYYFLDWMSVRLADKVLLDTDQHIDYFVQEFKAKREKFHRIFIGAHDKIFFPSSSEKKQGDRLKVLFWGWIIPLHGVEVILDAVKILSNEPMDFLFIGGGVEKGTMMEKAKRLDLANVEFMESIPAEKLTDYIHETDICLGIFGVTDKTKRVIPNKVYEAFACRKAVVTADTPAAREILVDRQHCLFSKVGDSADLAERILELKDNLALRSQIAEKGYNLYKEKFTPRALAAELLNILKI